MKSEKPAKQKSAKKPSESPKHGHAHPDHTPELKRISRIIGQLEGVSSMIQKGRYCVDILQQTRAVRAAVAALEAKIFEHHIGHCVHDAFNSSDEKEAKVKASELVELFKRQL